MRKILLAIIIFILVDLVIDEWFLPKFETKYETVFEKNRYFRKIIQLLVIVSSEIGITFGTIVLYAMQNATNLMYYTFFSFLLSLSTVVAGFLESIYFLHKFKSKNKNVLLSKEEKRRLVKFEGVGYEKGRGVYDYSFQFMKYAFANNILGALTIISFIWYLKGVPSYATLILKLENDQDGIFQSIAKFLTEIIFPFMVLLCFEHIRSIHKKSSDLSSQDFERNIDLENPFIYSFKRFHVNFNLLHFCYTMSMALFLILTYLLFIGSNFRKIEFTLSMLVPLTFFLLFFHYSSSSYYARKIGAVSVNILFSGAFVISVICLAIVISHKPTNSLLYLFLFLVVYYSYLYKLYKKHTPHKENLKENLIPVYSLVIVVGLGIIISIIFAVSYFFQ